MKASRSCRRRRRRELHDERLLENNTGSCRCCSGNLRPPFNSVTRKNPTVAGWLARWLALACVQASVLSETGRRKEKSGLLIVPARRS